MDQPLDNSESVNENDLAAPRFQLNRWRSIVLLIAGALLLSFSFAPYNFLLGAMLGLVPLLLVENEISSDGKWRKWRVFLSAYLFFAVFNFATIWWVKNASWVGVIASVVVNSLFFAFITVLYSNVKKQLTEKAAHMAFVALFIGWEFIELLDWDLSWPWLTLGHSLGNWVGLAQWYEYTGVLGGSLWLVLINMQVYFIVKSWNAGEDLFLRFKNGLRLAGIVVVPILFSLILFWSYEEKGEEADVVVLQPNMHPYSDRFMDDMGVELPRLSIADHVEAFTKMADSLIDNNVDYLLMHETALPKTENNYELNYSQSLRILENWRKQYPNMAILTGIAIRDFKNLDSLPSEIPATYKRAYGGKQYYEYFNSSINLNGVDSLQLYHKSRLVIGVERIPSYFVYFQRYMEDFDSDMNATEFNPNNGTQSYRSVFKGVDDSIVVAPIICYESVFGEYITDYVKKGANFLGVITNDSWWGDTPGYKQHWAFSKLRAIETRRSVARSANTGWSGFINQKGEELQRSEYYTRDVLREKIKLNEEQTFYVEFGDVVGKIAVGFSIMVLLNLFVKTIKNRATVRL